MGMVRFLRVLLLLLVGCATSQLPPPAKPTSLPPVELVTLDGKPARLDEALRGKVGLVSLWATWCEACAHELDALARLDGVARRAGATVIAVAEGEDRAKVAEFTRRRGLPWAQLVDERFLLGDALGQKRVPATLVVDRAGAIVFVGGALDAAALAALQRALADGKPATELARE
jgi:thiol-disulfide isomerase/thioredoxin